MKALRDQIDKKGMTTRDDVRDKIAEILVNFKQDKGCMYPGGCSSCDGGWACIKSCLVLQDYVSKILAIYKSEGK